MPEKVNLGRYLETVVLKLGDFTSALQSHQRALDIRIKLLGEQHSGTARSYHSLGVTQHELGDFTSARQSIQRALVITVKLLVKEHSDTAQSFLFVVVCFCLFVFILFFFIYLNSKFITNAILQSCNHYTFLS